MRILVGSPVRQKSSILKEFLLGLEEADFGQNEVAYFFVDDNTEEASSELLKAFAETRDVIIQKGSNLFDADAHYEGHVWQAANLARITAYKNKMISHCIDQEFDYLFLIDSDIVLDKRCVLQLLSNQVDIVSNVFWTQWRKNGILTPQCFWIPDIYLQDKAFNVPMTFEEAHKIRMDMVEKLKTPGLYKVDGLGACTMISRRALEMGVSFKEIPNLRIPGEDRPFCIRAGALGIDLYMDSTYPVYHINKEIYLDRVDEFRRDGFKFDMCRTFEEEPKKKHKFEFARKFLLRVGRKLVRDFSD